MNQELIAAFRAKLLAGKVVGPFMKTGDPAFVEAAGYAGMDFAILDMEHGPVSAETMQNNIRAAQLAGMLPVVRVPAISEEAIGKVLDIGAAAVQVPQITCAEDAGKAVRFAKFYPKGERGVCRFVRAAHYSNLERSAYFKTANEALVFIQLEGGEAIRNLDAILSVEGIDLAFIGPYDLSQSLGVPGEVNHPTVIAEMKKIVEAAKAKGIAVGVFADTVAAAKMWLEAGVQYISYSVDVGIFSEACANLVSAI